MFENYEKDFSTVSAIERIKEQRGVETIRDAIRIARKEIPKEPYYQNKIRKMLQQNYPDGFCRKVSQGFYAEAGMPDLLFVYKGHYFGFEVKRPLVGVLSEIQRRTISLIRQAGGTAEVVSWPEEVIEAIERWERTKGV